MANAMAEEPIPVSFQLAASSNPLLRQDPAVYLHCSSSQCDSEFDEFVHTFAWEVCNLLRSTLTPDITSATYQPCYWL